MFQFSRFALPTLCIQVGVTLAGWVSPFGNPRIKACLPAPRGLSQATTSFIACNRQGIHHMHLFAWPYNFEPSDSASEESQPQVKTHVCGIRQGLSRTPDTIKPNVRFPPGNRNETRHRYWNQNLYFFRFFKEHYSLWSKSQNEAPTLDSGFLDMNGGGERDRTDDLLLAKQALSQLSYTPEPNKLF